MTDITTIIHGKQRQAIEAMIEIFGDDTETILNALHEMAARIAIASEVSPEDFTAGVKHHWDFLANAINRTTTQ